MSLDLFMALASFTQAGAQIGLGAAAKKSSGRQAQLAREAAPHAAAGLAARWFLLAGGAGVALAVLAGLASSVVERVRYEGRIQMSEEDKRREVLEDQGHPAARRFRDMLADRALSLDAPTASSGAAAGMVDMERPGGDSPLARDR